MLKKVIAMKENKLITNLCSRIGALSYISTYSFYYDDNDVVGDRLNSYARPTYNSEFYFFNKNGIHQYNSGELINSYGTSNSKEIIGTECKINPDQFPAYHESLNINNSILFSCLIPKTNASEINLLLYRLKQTLSSLTTKTWQAKIISTKIGNLRLINLFMTTNDQPQVVHLGYDIITVLIENNLIYEDAMNYAVLEASINEYSDYSDFMAKVNHASDKLVEQLKKPSYQWHTAGPLKYYQQHLVVLGNNKKQKLQKLLDFYQTALKTALNTRKTDNISKYSRTKSNSIDLLDLNGLINSKIMSNHYYLRYEQRPKDINKAESDPEVKEILTDLAKNL